MLHEAEGNRSDDHSLWVCQWLLVHYTQLFDPMVIYFFRQLESSTFWEMSADGTPVLSFKYKNYSFAKFASLISEDDWYKNYPELGTNSSIYYILKSSGVLSLLGLGLNWVSVPSSFLFLAKEDCFNELTSRRKTRINAHSMSSLAEKSLITCTAGLYYQQQSVNT